MASYSAPLRDMQFVLEEVIGLDQVATLPGYEAVSDDLVRAVLAEAGKFGAVSAGDGQLRLPIDDVPHRPRVPPIPSKVAEVDMFTDGEALNGR